jgi:putative ABC transport system ATP-binding protein
MLFELERVTIERDSKVVLQDVTASLPRGASCVAGPSGSGKSTLLRLLNRLADPVSGLVRYEGGDVCERDPLELRREVCLVPQLPALLEGTVEDNIRFAGDLAGRDPDVSRLLDLAGLNPTFAERPASRLSVGEQQRVMLARSLALEPRVLLLDEPTSALDAEARGAVEATLLHLRERVNASTVLVTHDLAQARRMADWVVRLDEGRMVGEGRVQEHLPV